MARSYLPVGDVNLASWYTNFSTKLNTLYGAQLGFTNNELQEIVNDSAAFASAVQYKESMRAAAVASTAIVKRMRSDSPHVPVGTFPVVQPLLPMNSNNTGMFNRVPVYVTRIKNNSAYNHNMGIDLGIIAPASTFDPNTAKPTIKARLESGYPRVSWKRGEADSVQLYVDRRDGNGFVPLAVRTGTSYIDVEPLPANTFSVTWDYKAKYMINDNEIGLFSEPVSITVIRA